MNFVESILYIKQFDLFIIYEFDENNEKGTIYQGNRSYGLSAVFLKKKKLLVI